ncbi:formimidoylglutamase [candidate division KSB1 bacterium]|nr:formimidoylglutamase [candidate division KSB1 bacterium]
MNNFNNLVAPDENLFFHKNDPNDPRMGELVGHDINLYDSAEIILLGCPQDEGVKRNHGRPGAAEAPQSIRRQFYKLPVPEGMHDQGILDVGDMKIRANLEDIHAALHDVVYQFISDKKKVIVLGGGNDISYPDAKALSRFAPNLVAFNIDAHFDVRADEPRNSGTPYRQLLEETHVYPDHFYELGFQPLANSVTYKNYLIQKGVHICSLKEFHAAGVQRTCLDILKNISTEAIFWGFDVDSVRASDAPGVSAPSPLGLSATNACDIAALAGADPRSRIFEITEVNPVYDIDNRTSKLAALMVLHFIMSHIKQECNAKQD